MRVPFYKLQSNFTSSKFILQVENKITSSKLRFTSCKFKEIILRVASYVLWVENSKILFYEFPVAFYRLNIYDANYTNYHHMVESNFKGINLHKLCEKAVLINCILTLDNLNTHSQNAIETVIRTSDLSNSSSYRNYLAVLYNNCFMHHNDYLVSFVVWVIKSKF